MRKVNYIARKKDGTEFTTTDYKLATEGGNRIFKTFLTEVKNEDPKAQKWASDHAARIKEVLLQKGSL